MSATSKRRASAIAVLPRPPDSALVRVCACSCIRGQLSSDADFRVAPLDSPNPSGYATVRSDGQQHQSLLRACEIVVLPEWSADAAGDTAARLSVATMAVAKAA